MSDEQEHNFNKYLDLIRQLDPEFFLLRVDMETYKIHPYVLRRIVRALYNITTYAFGTGYGKVQIFVEKNKVSSIKPEETDRIDLEISVQEEIEIK